MSDTNRAPVVPPRRVAELRNDPYAGFSGELSIDNAMRAMGRGAILAGPYADELDAGTHAVLAPYIDPLLPDSWIPDLPGRTLGERYDNALARQRGADKAFDDRHPYISQALQLLGKAGSAAAYGPGPIIGDIAAAGIEGFGSEEGGFSNRAKRAVHDAAEEALKVFGLDALKGRVMPAKAGTEGDRKAGAKAALTRALLRARGRNGGGGGW
ncbi:hypothetical protein [Rhizobium laguerreae]|uniref:hypothetical protein n=1 Tax=Rhizobium laguerreae TaxID=1076926 RepID=UPI001C907A3A|nr:hypothetical protein [Rhizobium laguerreae]MBY3036295.1 hypothetical protein [Rhizobium laguerreae]